MSQSEHTPKEEHGTMASYVSGFLLSLMLTASAYYVVVSKTFTGRALLATILTFAVLQMAVQILFFLHLGRGPKPLYNVTFFAGTVALIIVVVLGSIFITDNLNYSMSPQQITTRLAEKEGIAQVDGAKTGACEQIYTNHKVTISNGKVSPSLTQARLCDTLTFVNLDDTTRDIAFGPHPEHRIYGGESDVKVRKGYPKIVTLNQPGTYLYHDHIDPGVAGSFSVSP